jgi:hypothetical protein
VHQRLDLLLRERRRGVPARMRHKGDQDAATAAKRAFGNGASDAVASQVPGLCRHRCGRRTLAAGTLRTDFEAL